MQPNPLQADAIAANVTYRLRRDFEKSGGPVHRLLIASSIIGYLAEFPGQPLYPADDPVSGLGSHFIQWLKQNPPPGGGNDGEELRQWISEYPN